MGGESWGLEDEHAQNASIEIHENAIIMMKPIIGHGGYKMPSQLLRIESSRLAWVTELVQGQHRKFSETLPQSRN